MANLRSPHRLRQGLTVDPAESPRLRRRWPVFVALGVAGLLMLAWAEGGESPLRPIAEAVQLPEQP
ncbi:MAG: hypothetical protein C0471_12555 [Erythrobacter sp.]|nr:hypothetical protein [Erythrobacter sp.]